jgi:serine/threonine protein phosphatase PrpC
MKTRWIETNKKLLILQLVEFVAFGILLLFLPRPTEQQILAALPYALDLGSGLMLFFVVNSYLRVRHSWAETQKRLWEAEIFREQTGYLSDVGKKRELDEDSILIVKAFSTYGEKPATRTLLIVADGMGGHSKGELASSLGASIVTEECFSKLIDKDPKIDYEAALSKSMEQANQKILKYSIEHPECEGMGTTMTAAITDDNRVFLAHVGDTRAYIVRTGEITQLTKDHSYVQELVDKGEITPEEARTHPKKNVITRVVGYYSEVQIDTYNRVIDQSDMLLLCCDGLPTHVTDEEINEIVSTSLTPKEAVERLVKLANDHGGADNISVVLTPMFGGDFSNSQSKNT